MQNWLIKMLDIGGHNGPQRLQDLISQDPEIVSTRSRLAAEISKLRDIQKELRSLGYMNEPTDGVASKANTISRRTSYSGEIIDNEV